MIVGRGLVVQVEARRGPPRALLHGVDVALPAGTVTAILGRNGAGKSTLLEVLAGDRRPAAGGVTLGQWPIQTYGRAAIARRRAVLPQHADLRFPYTAAEVVALGRHPFHGTPDARHDAAALSAVRARLELDRLWTAAYPGLSGGEKARVQFARVLAQLWRPPGAGSDMAGALLLDEPTAALDLAEQRRMVGIVRALAAEGLAIGVVLHDLDVAAAMADRCILLDRGRVAAAGPTAEVLRAEVLGPAFGVSFTEATALRAVLA